MSRSAIVTFLLLSAGLVACSREEGESVVKQDSYVKFASHLGCSFVAPSRWTTKDEGDTFSLKSPDGQAIIHAIMYTAEGSGSLDEFQETMTTGLLPTGATQWKDSSWSTIKCGDVDANKRELVPVPESDREWRLYVVDGGKFYHALIVNASSEAMTLNGEFYESIVRSFEGVRE